MPKEKAWILTDEYTGQSTKDKYKAIAEKMGDSADSLILSTLDDIVWVLNLRGSDIAFNPVFFCYLLFHKGGGNHRCDLFVDQSKVSDPSV